MSSETPVLDAAGDLARQASDRFAAWRRTRVGWRGMLLYLLPWPLPFAAIIALAKGEGLAALAALGAFGLFLAGAQLTRRGIREELLVPQRRFGRPVRLRFKYFGAAAVAAGCALTAGAVAGHTPLTSLLFALTALAGYHLAYRMPAPARPATVDAEPRVRRALAQAEQRIISLEVAADAIGNPELQTRLERIAARGRSLLHLIAERPDELFRARKFLSVHLEGAARVASRFAKTHRLARTRALEDNFRRVLEEIETVFEREHAQLLQHDAGDLDVQIAVLRRRLEEEGIV